MGDLVEKRLETVLPELRMMMKAKVLSSEEMRRLIKKYRNMEQRILRQDATRRDYLQCVRHELNTQLLLKTRFQRLGTKPKIRTKIQALTNRRIVHTYNRAVKRFKGDSDLWLQYARHCVKSGSSRAAGKVFARALAIHQGSEELWLAASSWEMEGNGNVKTARRLAQRALRALPHSRKLWVEYFHLELSYLAKLRARRESLGIPVNDAKTVDSEGGGPSPLSFWQGGVVVVVLKGAIDALRTQVEAEQDSVLSTSFITEFIDTAKDMPSIPSSLVDDVAHILVQAFPRNTSIREASALRHLRSTEQFNEEVASLSWSELRQHAVEMESKTMWKRCLQFAHVYCDQFAGLPETATVIADALEHNFILQMPGEDEEAEDEKTDSLLIKEAVENNKKLSLAQWESLWETFEQQTTGQRKHALSLCNAMEKNIFGTEWSFDAEIADLWITMLRQHVSAKTARNAYEKALLKSGDKAILLRAAIRTEISLSNGQDEHVQKARALYRRLADLCGREDIEVWAEWIDFERTQLDFRSAGQVYWKALKVFPDKEGLDRRLTDANLS